MRATKRKRAIEVCNAKIVAKGNTAGLSFYAFFANKNDDLDALMEAAGWWIKINKFDHFETAVKLRTMIEMTE